MAAVVRLSLFSCFSLAHHSFWSLEFAAFPLYVSILSIIMTSDVFLSFWSSSRLVMVVRLPLFSPPLFSVTRAWEWEEQKDFLWIFSLRRLLATWLMDTTPSGAESLKDTNKVSQLSGSELIKRSAWSSSSKHHLYGSKMIHNILNLIEMLDDGLIFLEVEVDKLSNQECLVAGGLPFMEIFKLLGFCLIFRRRW